jgi:predicted TIM-barrel fold metal-dependent hydrolase
MTTFARSDAVAAIRDRIDHPVVDADGHLIEYLPLLFDFVRDVAGADVQARLRHFNRDRFGADGGFLPVRVFHGLPAENTLDRMTATLPQLMHRRLDEFGIDFALLYPSFGLTLLALPDDEVRTAACRAYNLYVTEAYRDVRDRLEPVALIPTFTPGEAEAEIRHAVGVLGLKTVVMSGVVPRRVRPDGTEHPWVDTLGHESQFDYDPVWAACCELHVAPAFHGIGYGWGSRVSSRNYVHNHLGNFAAAQEAACRSLVMGGVLRRFPDLRCTFLEGGVTWACQLYADLLGHFEKRNGVAVRAFDDATLDLPLATALYDEYATGAMAGDHARFATVMERAADAARAVDATAGVDDFAESGIRSADDIVDIFSRQFSFGCEADDPMNALAFDRHALPHGVRLAALFASDIGHWDVPDAREVLLEAWELVEDGRLDHTDFADFTGWNVVRTLTAANPTFFAGTALGGIAAPPSTR